MTCRFRDAVAAQLLGGLPARESLALDEHVLGCDECASERRELSIVRTMLDTLDRTALPVPADAVGPSAGTLATVTAVRQRRPRPGRRDVRLVLLGAAAALVVGVLPVGAWALTHAGGARSVELAGTALAPDAWATVRFVPRTEGTIVDVEAGDLPSGGARYVVTVTRHSQVLARQEFTVDPDGWAQVVLATPEPVRRGDVVTVERVDGRSPVAVLGCGCTV